MKIVRPIAATEMHTGSFGLDVDWVLQNSKALPNAITSINQ